MTELLYNLAGAACIIGAAAAYGESRARFIEQRVRQLQQLQRSLKLLTAEILFAQSLLPAAFRTVGSLSEPPVKNLFVGAADLLAAGRELTAQEAWEESLQQVYPQTSFSEADLEIIKSLGVSLGISQREGQLKQIQLAEQHISFSLEEAQQSRERQARMWRFLGFIGGATLVILLL